MRYAISQAYARSLPAAEMFQLFAGAGFDCFEVFTTPLDYRFTDVSGFAAFREELERSGFTPVQAHLPFWDGVDIGNYNSIIRSGSVKNLREAIRRSGELGKPRLIVHPGTWNGSADPALNAVFKQLVLDALRELADYAGELGLTLCVENMPWSKRDEGMQRYGALTEEIVDICGEVPGLRACLDTGHAFHNGERPDECLRRLDAAGLLAALHVHDTDGFPNDRHWLPGEGGIDWAAFRAALVASGYAERGGALLLEIASFYKSSPEALRRGMEFCQTFNAG